jgi:putative transposase
MPPRPLFKMTPASLKELRVIEGKPLSNRKWLRVRALRLLSKGRTVQEVAEGLGTFPRVVRRVRDGYLAGGLAGALEDAPKSNRLKARLDDGQAAKIVSLACSAPPAGAARWTLSLLAEEAVRRGIAPVVSRDNVHKILKRHDLKPWREKNVVRTEIRRRVRGPDGRRVEIVLGTIEEGVSPGVPR